MDIKKACIIAFVAFILAIAAYSLAQFNFTNKLAAPSTPCTNFTFLQSFGGNSTVCNPVPNLGQFTYFFTNETSLTTVNASKRMLITPNATETIKTYSNLNGNPVQNWTSMQGTPGLTFIPAGSFAVHIHASASSNNQVKIFARIWEVNNTGVYLNIIGDTEPELLTNVEEQYNMVYQAPNTTFLQSNQSRLMVQIMPQVLIDNPSVTLYFGGEADSKIQLPSQVVDATNFVPYAGATQDVNLGTHNLTVNNITSPDLINLENNITSANNSMNNLKVNKSGDTVTGNLTFTNSNGISGGLRYKAGFATRDLSLGSGTQFVNIGFQPSVIQFNTAIHATTSASWGFDDNTTAESIFDSTGDKADTYERDTTNSIVLEVNDSIDYAFAKVNLLNSSGFRLTWTNVGRPVGTATIEYLAYR